MRTATINTPEKQKEKFEENYRIEEIGGAVHWIWTGRVNRGKYPTWFDGYTEVTARRAALALYRFAVPKGRRIINTCRVSACVHPYSMGYRAPAQVFAAGRPLRCLPDQASALSSREVVSDFPAGVSLNLASSLS